MQTSDSNASPSPDQKKQLQKDHRISDLIKQLASMKSTMKANQEQLVQMNQYFAKHQIDKIEMENSKLQACNKVKILQKQLEEMKEATSPSKSQSPQEMQAIKLQLNKAKRDVKRKEGDMDELNKIIDYLKDQLRTKKKEIQHSQQLNQATQKEINLLKKDNEKVKNVQRRCSKLENLIKQKDDQIKKKQNQLKNEKSKKSPTPQTTQKISQLEAQLKKMQELLNSKQQEIEESKKFIGESQSSPFMISPKRLEFNSQSRNQEQQSEFRAFTSRSYNLQHTRNSSVTSFQQKDMIINKLKQKLEKVQAMLIEAKPELKNSQILKSTDSEADMFESKLSQAAPEKDSQFHSDKKVVFRFKQNVEISTVSANQEKNQEFDMMQDEEEKENKQLQEVLEQKQSRKNTLTHQDYYNFPAFMMQKKIQYFQRRQRLKQTEKRDQQERLSSIQMIKKYMEQHQTLTIVASCCLGAGIVLGSFFSIKVFIMK